jgi:hypothetical protein
MGTIRTYLVDYEQHNTWGAEGPLWVKRDEAGPGHTSFHVRFAPKATQLLRSSGMPQRATCIFSHRSKATGQVPPVGRVT